MSYPSSGGYGGNYPHYLPPNYGQTEKTQFMQGNYFVMQGEKTHFVNKKNDLPYYVINQSRNNSNCQLAK